MEPVAWAWRTVRQGKTIEGWALGHIEPTRENCHLKKGDTLEKRRLVFSNDRIVAENRYFREALTYIKNNVGIGGKSIKLLCEAILKGDTEKELDLDELDKIKET